ncbi:MAG: hypothetical protein ACYC4J_00800 [Gemmatimonadaceae bacterium]
MPGMVPEGPAPAPRPEWSIPDIVPAPPPPPDPIEWSIPGMAPGERVPMGIPA